jgi:hypothetical protein
VTPQPLPDEHHIARYVGASKIYPSFDGKRRVDSERFLPRADYPPGAGPEEFVSVDWLEHFQGISRRQQLDQIHAALQRRGITVSRKGGFVVVTEIMRQPWLPQLKNGFGTAVREDIPKKFPFL